MCLIIADLSYLEQLKEKHPILRNMQYINLFNEKSKK
jgi:hypothetical protein